MERNVDSQVLKNSAPVVDFEFQRSPLLYELFDVFNSLPNQILNDFLEILVSPRISMMRQQPIFAKPSSDNIEFKNFMMTLRKIPKKLLCNSVMAASIITNVSPSDIVNLAHLDLCKTEIDLIELTLSTIYAPESTVGFRSTGKITVIKVRPIIPETLYRYFKSKDLYTAEPPTKISTNYSNDLNLQSDEIIHELINPPGFYSEDFSTCFNKRNGLPDVTCYNDIDNESPLIIKWVDVLNFPKECPNNYEGCHTNCINCLKCHQVRMEDGRKTLTYQSDGRINIDDLKDHVPLIFECNEKCCCDSTKCPNRVVQKRWNWKLAVIRTTNSFGWTVRTFEFIPKGSFVCEMLGRVISCQSELEVLFQSNNHNGHSLLYNLDAYHVPVDSMLILDTRDHGNISSYIEPSTLPNLVPISICTERSISYHKIAFFAIRDIYPNEDLYFHPNYMFDWSKHLMKLHKK